MNFNVLIVAAIAVGTTIGASQAKDASAQAGIHASAGENDEVGKTSLLKQILRGGRKAPTPPPAEAVETAAAGTPSAGAPAEATAPNAPPAQPVGETEMGLSYNAVISHFAARYGVPEALAHAVIKVESNYRPTARGRAGEVGLMQIKPSTARAIGYQGSTGDLFKPETNIKYGMKYLGEAVRLGGGDTCGTILKYNAGHGAKRMNPVSSAYCAKVKRLLAAR